MIGFALTFFLSMILAMFFTPLVAKKIGKRNTIITGTFIAAFGIFVRIIAGHNVVAFFIGNVVTGLGGGLAASLLLAMMSDAVDLSELRYGVRAQGLMYAADSFSIKLGTAFGGAIVGWVLAAGRYVPNVATQSPSATNAIFFVFQWAPFIGFTVAGLLLFLYDLDKSIGRVREELKAKRDAEATTIMDVAQ